MSTQRLSQDFPMTHTYTGKDQGVESTPKIANDDVQSDIDGSKDY